MRRVRETKLRLLRGRAVSFSALRLWPVSVASVWRMGATPVTSTDWETSPTSSLTSTRAIWLTSILKGPSCAFLKPESSAVRRYSPMGRKRIL
jgi:hypothetical protein